MTEQQLPKAEPLQVWRVVPPHLAFKETVMAVEVGRAEEEVEARRDDDEVDDGVAEQTGGVTAVMLKL